MPAQDSRSSGRHGCGPRLPLLWLPPSPMRVLQTFTEPPRPCSYLPDATASLQYRVMTNVSPEELDRLLVRGWRRFGPYYFRPVCDPCGECISIRIPVEAFVPSTSQRRARRRCRGLRIEVGPPIVDRQRLALYERWHHGRESAREWEPAGLGAEEYYLQFAFPHPSVREVSWWDGDRLVAVGICDVTPSCWSAVYFFYDPTIERASPGIANVVLCTELAREAGIPHVYLGYRIEGCASMRYKSRFRPYETLVGRPEEDEEPRWVEPPQYSGDE